MPKQIQFIQFDPVTESGCWRLIKVLDINLVNNEKYIASLIFEKIGDYSLEETKKLSDNILRSFNKNQIVKKECSIEYFKLFIIGSLWINGRIVSLPSYFEQFIINKNFIDSSKILKQIQIDEKYLPVTQYEYKDIITYKFENRTKINTNSDIDIEFSFIAFYKPEIHRYFYTGKGGSGDINSRIIKYNLEKKNQLFIPEFSKKETDSTGKISYNVFLKHRTDENNVEIIGNLIYIPKFKDQINSVMTRIHEQNTKNCFFYLELPFTNFDLLNIYAKRVKSKDGQWGILVFQINECKGYNNQQYSPWIDGAEGNSGKKSKFQKFKKTKKKKKATAEDNFDHDINVQPTSNETEFDEDELTMNILNPPNDVFINEFQKRKRTKKRGKIKLFTQKDTKESGSASEESTNGEDNNAVFNLEEIDFFDVFQEVVKKLHHSLIKHHATEITYLNSNHEFNSAPEKQFFSYNHKGIKGGFKYYLVRVNITGNNYYLLEVNENEMPVSDRTTFFQIEENRKSEETEIKKLLDHLFYETKLEDFTVINKYGFNHRFLRLKEKIAQLKNNSKNHEFIEYMTKEEAIEHHAEKIYKHIIELK